MSHTISRRKSMCNVICRHVATRLMLTCCDELAEEETRTKHSIADARRERVMLGEAREEDKE